MAPRKHTKVAGEYRGKPLYSIWKTGTWGDLEIVGYRYNNLDYTLDEWTSYVLTDIQREESAANVPLPEPGDDEMEEQQPTINDLETQRVQDSQGSLPDLPSLS